jgi:GT2 family glycosyltransferase
LVSGYAAGAKIASSEHLFFCNEDMWFDEDCLHLLEEKIDLGRNIVAADPWQWTYDGEVWIHGGTRFRKSRWNFNSCHPFRANNFVVPLALGEKTPFPCAGAFLIHRQAYEEIGGWDTDFFLDHEDVDLGIRIWQRGWEVAAVPQAKVYHAVNVSNSKHLANVRQPVSKRRYISGRASLSIMPLKYYSPIPAISAALSLYLTVLAKDALRGLWERTHFNLLAGRQILARAPEALRFRAANRSWNRLRPGERFFTDPNFAESESSG